MSGSWNHCSESSVGEHENDETDWFALKDILPWGRGREARNLSRANWSPSFTEAHSLIEKGITNYIAYIGKDRADSGMEYILIEGIPRRGMDLRAGKMRDVALISGTIYQPKVFDVFNHSWKYPADRYLPKMPLPTWVFFEVLPDRVAPRFERLGTWTSDEYIHKLLLEYESLKLFEVTKYRIPFELACDPLMWTVVEGIKEIGSLFTPDQCEPLLSAEMTEIRRQQRKQRGPKLDMRDPNTVALTCGTLWMWEGLWDVCRGGMQIVANTLPVYRFHSLSAHIVSWVLMLNWWTRIVREHIPTFRFFSNSGGALRLTLVLFLLDLQTLSPHLTLTHIFFLSFS